MSGALDRFVEAQDSNGIYDRALAELRQGRKTSHWVWFVFPQIAGLGQSEMSRRYAIADLEEARAYVDHPILGPRLIDCCNAVLAHQDKSAEEILGGIDALKLRSSMTLFARAAGNTEVFQHVLTRYFDNETDPETDARLES
jgi:uncharacterized protein (DUF1810 family)